MSQFNLLMTIRSYPLQLLNLNKFSSQFFLLRFWDDDRAAYLLFFKYVDAADEKKN